MKSQIISITFTTFLESFQFYFYKLIMFLAFIVDGLTNEITSWSVIANQVKLIKTTIIVVLDSTTTEFCTFGPYQLCVMTNLFTIGTIEITVNQILKKFPILVLCVIVVKFLRVN